MRGPGETRVKAGITGLLLSVVGMVPSGHAQILCLPIQQVSVNGVTLLASSEIEGLVAPFEGRCLGLSEFDEILEAVTLSYVDAGYILSRAYLPEQDLSDGVLDIDVIEGEISEIRVNGAADPRWMGMVFPGQVGEPVNLRLTEQGLDQIEGMPRWTATIDYDAGEDPGDTILLVDAQTDKPWELRFTTHNRGNENSGLWVSGLEGDATNLLGINDTLTYGVTHSLNPGPLSFDWSGDRSRSANIGLTVPYGPWTFGITHSRSDYTLTIPGAIDPIPTEGNTASWNVTGKYLLHRDQETKTHLSFDLSRNANENYIYGVLIEGSSRVLTPVRVTLSHERPLRQGSLEASGWAEHGFGLFGAEDASDMPAGQPDAQYWRFGASATYDRSWDLEAGRMAWNATANLQISGDRLYGGQQFSLGGVPSVRGSRIALATGSSGITLRNELSFFPADLQVPFFGGPEFYAGLDIGRVFPQTSLDVLGGTAMGMALGTRFGDGPLTLDISYQKVIGGSDWIQRPEGEVFISMEYAF